MALPKLNQTLNFKMKIPSTGKTVKFRPYLVKEEKVLLQAYESGDTVTALESMVDTIAACVDPKDKLDVAKLTTFDVEYMFLQVRSKSVGETSTIVLRCEKCEHENPVKFTIDGIEVDMKDQDNIIELNDEISVEMKYPSYQTLMQDDMLANAESGDDAVNAETAFAMLAGSIAAVLTEEERIDLSDQSKEEIEDFMNSMTSSQLQKIAEFLENIPALEHEIKYKCTECSTENEIKLKGLADFF
jgi:DNA-directed RNA polymerase subunit M/transcription elongation factor TFIIS